MKNFALKILLLALVAGSALASPARAADRAPLDYRRTLFVSVGQHLLVFEAPAGMCFLNESDYLEGSLMSHVKDMAEMGGGGKLVATFSDCLELSKVEGAMQDQMAGNTSAQTAIGVGEDDADAVTLKSQGTISWLDPGQLSNEEQLSMPRADYLDVRAKTFRDDMVKNVGRAYGGHARPDAMHGNMSTVSFTEAPEKYLFDGKVHRTADGISLAYVEDTEMEYKKIHSVGIVGTTLLRQLPMEFSFTFSGSDRDQKALYALMDTFLAQQAILNNY